MSVRSRAEKVEVPEPGALLQLESSGDPVQEKGSGSVPGSARAVSHTWERVDVWRTLPFPTARVHRPCRRLHGTGPKSDALQLSCLERTAIGVTPGCRPMVSQRHYSSPLPHPSAWTRATYTQAMATT